MNYRLPDNQFKLPKTIHADRIAHWANTAIEYYEDRTEQVRWLSETIEEEYFQNTNLDSEQYGAIEKIADSIINQVIIQNR